MVTVETYNPINKSSLGISVSFKTAKRTCLRPTNLRTWLQAKRSHWQTGTRGEILLDPSKSSVEVG